MARAYLDGITSRMIQTPRLNIHVLEAGTPGNQPMLLVHGNLSSSRFWEETMSAISAGFWVLAPDMRGYGDTELLPLEATRGLQDLSNDLHSLVETVGWNTFHLAGHSLGGTVVLHYTRDHPERVRTLTLVASGSPYGYGGTRDVHGTPCWPDYAGSGGGLIALEFLRRLAEGDRSDESDFSPRRLLCQRLVKPPFVPPHEEALLDAMLQTNTSEDNYSRNLVASPNWPGIAPGTRGINNALSPKYCNLSDIVNKEPKPPILWIRGDSDQVVSDRTLSDPGTLGSLGMIPGWPGADVYPPQPMVGQIRAVLERYQANGGTYQEHVLESVGHMPHIEKPAEFQRIWQAFLSQYC